MRKRRPTAVQRWCGPSRNADPKECCFSFTMRVGETLAPTTTRSCGLFARCALLLCRPTWRIFATCGRQSRRNRRGRPTRECWSPLGHRTCRRLAWGAHPPSNSHTCMHPREHAHMHTIFQPRGTALCRFGCAGALHMHTRSRTGLCTHACAEAQTDTSADRDTDRNTDTYTEAQPKTLTHTMTQTLTLSFSQWPSLCSFRSRQRAVDMHKDRHRHRHTHNSMRTCESAVRCCCVA